MTDARTILLVRPEAQAAAFAAALDARFPGRFRPVPAPVFAIEPLPVTIELDGVQGLVFTSVHGVAAFAARQLATALPAWCVGAATAAAARAAGFAAVSADGDAAALARLVAEVWRPGAGDVLHLRGAHAAGDLVGAPAGGRSPGPRPRRLRPAGAAAAAGGAGAARGRRRRPRSPSSRRAERDSSPRKPGRRAGRSARRRRCRSAPPPTPGSTGSGSRRRLVARRPDRPGMLAAIARL